MSRQLQTDGGDLAVVEGELAVTSGRESLAQSIGQRLQTVRGEWRYDLSHGLPYLDEISSKAPLSVTRAILREAILETPGVVEVIRLDLSLDARTRELMVSGEVRGEDGYSAAFTPVKVGSHG